MPTYSPVAQRASERLLRAADRLRTSAERLSDPQRAIALRHADALDQVARTLEHGARAGTTSERVTRSALARATGALARAPVEARDLARAGTTLGKTALGGQLGNAMRDLQPAALPEKAKALAAQLRSGVAPQDQEELAEAAAQAARQLDRLPQLQDALERLAQALVAGVPGQPSEESASAANAVGRAAQDPLQTALLQRLTGEAAGEARRAWNELAGGGAGEGRGDATDEPSAGSPSGDRATGSPSEPGSESDQEGERAAGGGRRAGSASGGAPARGASGTTPVAGRGSGSLPAGQRPEPPAARGSASRLRSALGQHGQAVAVALDELRRGEPSASTRDLVARYGAVEEEALRRDPVPAERRELVRTYLEAIRR